MLNPKSLLKVLSAVLLSFVPIGWNVEVARSQTPAEIAPVSAKSELRHDGFYASRVEGKGYDYYLWFYPDGTGASITVSSIKNSTQLTPLASTPDWYRVSSKGTYSITATTAQPQIQFATTSPPIPSYATVTVTYQGSIQKDKLTLESVSTNGNRDQRTYEFIVGPLPVRDSERSTLNRKAEQAANPPAPAITDSQLSDSKVGLVFKSGLDASPGALNIGRVVQQQFVLEDIWRERGVEYVNNCPQGKKAVASPRITEYGSDVSQREIPPENVGQSEVRAWFISQTTTPASGLRVVVRNLSQAGSGEIPYTNREYNQVPRSEDFIAALGNRHNSKFLSLNLGLNELSYDIKRGEQSVESGKFTVKITESTMPATRIVTIHRPKYELDCVNEK